MKKVSVKWTTSRNPVNCIYPNDSVSFAWLTPPSKTGLLYPASGWHSCRETFTSEICKLSTGVSGAPTKMDLSRVRIAVAFRHPVVKNKRPNTDTINKTVMDAVYENDTHWMKESIRLLNILEKSQGWVLSQIKKCTDIDYDNTGTVVFVLTSSCKWMRSPQLLSLYLLVVRLGRFYKDFVSFEGFEDLKKIAERFKKKTLAGVIGRDVSWFLKTWHNWEILLDNHHKLFFTDSMLENYKTNHGNMGIDNLDRNYASQKIINRWTEVKAFVK